MKRLLSLLVASQFAFFASAGEYEKAVEKAEREKKTLLVVLSAGWCPSCVQMKREVIEPMKQSELKDVVVVVLDVDTPENRPVIDRIKRGDQLPQIAIASKVAGAWKKLHAQGARSRMGILDLLKKVKE